MKEQEEIMRTLFIAITVTGVVIAGLIMRAVKSGKDSDKNELPDPEKVH
jgi:hypothetical protein